jgi:Cu-Zn family superoxide dismutase
MRYVLTSLLGAALLFGCGDDDGDTPTPVDSGAKDSGTVVDSGAKDAGSGSIDAAVDAGRIDSGLKDAGGAGDSSVGATSAGATLESKSSSTVTGVATFTTVNGVVTLNLSVSGASQGAHGAHIHVNGDCSAANASSAGDHWNPASHPHGSGAPDASTTSHLGDLGNVTIAGDGKGTLTISKPEWKIGDGSTMDVIGHAIVIHASQDDLVTQANADAGITPGNSGPRQACGVITGKK